MHQAWFAPPLAASAGGTRISIRGAGFVRGKPLTCKFGSALAQVRWLSSSVVVCVTPAHHPANVSLSVASNAV